jgi:hypothetical protein
VVDGADYRQIDLEHDKSLGTVQRPLNKASARNWCGHVDLLFSYHIRGILKTLSKNLLNFFKKAETWHMLSFSSCMSPRPMLSLINFQKRE